MDDTRRKSAYMNLLRRAAYIYLIQIAITVFEILIMCPLRGEAIPPISQLVLDTFCFRQGYDLLPFYVFMLALSPLVMELMRRNLAWVVGIASAGLFIWGEQGDHYQLLSLHITHTFYFVLWQAIFLIGLFAGTKLRWYSALPTRTKIATAAGFWMASIVIFFAAYGQHFNLALHTPLTFWKNPLTFGEVLRYLGLVGAIATTTDLLWRWIADSAVAAFVNRMGRRSLAMYITQIYLVGQIDHLVDRADGPWGTQFFFMAVAITVLWLFALALDGYAALKARLRDVQPAMSNRNLATS
jgi:hypothetical protein